MRRLALLALVGYMMLGPSGPDTWSGDDITINGNCASGTSEFLASSVATSNGRGEASCGPCMVPNVGITTKVHCNRDYTFGAGYESFFEEYAGRQLTLIQDAHDPNDVQWTRTGVVDQDTGHSSTQFATVTIPAGAEATFHCFVPIGCQEDHAHTPNEYPNFVDPQGGWTESSESYMEDNGIERKRFFKKVTAAGAPVTYPLHHTTHKGWGYVYLVELQKAGYCPVHTPPANKITVTDLHAGHACGPLLVPYPSSCSEVHCDRHYKFGNWEKGNQLGYRNWNSFFVPPNDNTRKPSSSRFLGVLAVCASMFSSKSLRNRPPQPVAHPGFSRPERRRRPHLPGRRYDGLGRPAQCTLRHNLPGRSCCLQVRAGASPIPY